MQVVYSIFHPVQRRAVNVVNMLFTNKVLPVFKHYAHLAVEKKEAIIFGACIASAAGWGLFKLWNRHSIAADLKEIQQWKQENQNLQEIENRLLELYEKDPCHAEVNFELTEYYLQKQEYDLAAFHREHVFVREPNHPVANWYRVSISFLQNDLEQAFTYLQQIDLLTLCSKQTDLQDSIMKTIKELGVRLYEQGEYEKALSCFNRVLEIKTTEPEACLYQGHVYAAQKKYQQAEIKYLSVKLSQVASNQLKIDADLGLAHISQAQNKYKEAILSFNDVLREDPENLVAKLSIRTIILSSIKSFSEEEKIAFLDTMPNSGYARFVAQWKKAHILIKLNRYEEAIACLEALASSSEDRSAEMVLLKDEVYLQWGIRLFKEHKCEEALEKLNLISERSSLANETVFVKGWVYFKLKQYRQAQACFDAALKIYPDDPYVNFGIGYNSLISREDYQETLTHFETALTEIEKNKGQYSSLYTEIHFRMGFILAEKISPRDYTRAQAHYLAALEESEGSHKARYGLARVYLKEGRYQEAKVEIEAFLETNPHHVKALKDKAKIDYYQGQYEIAKAGFRNALQLTLKNSSQYNDILCWIAKVYLQQGCYDEAEKILKSILKKDPQHIKALVEMGFCRYNRPLERHKTATDYFKKALQYRADDPVAVMGLGWVLYDEKQYSEAQKHFEQALRCNPYLRGAHVGLGWALYEQEQYEEARKAFRQAVTYEWDREEPLRGLGLCYSFEEKYTESIKAFEEALKWLDENKDKDIRIDTYFDLVEAYYQNGQTEEAKKYWRMVQKEKPDYEGLENYKELLERKVTFAEN